MFLAAFNTAAYNSKVAAKPTQKDTDDGDDMVDSITDELALDEQLVYQQKVTKWIRGALTSLQDMVFWFVMGVNFRARGPVRHMFAILSKYAKHSEQRGSCPTSELPIVNFITMRIEQINSEFVELRQTLTSWTQEIISEIDGMSSWLSTSNGDADYESLLGVALKLLSHNHSTFVRRIAKPFEGQGA